MEISLSTAIALYLVFVLAALGLIWLWTEISANRGLRDSKKQHFWRCSYCGYGYLDEPDASVSKCPRCQSYNAADKK